jgi:hypothetical protein
LKLEVARTLHHLALAPGGVTAERDCNNMHVQVNGCLELNMTVVFAAVAVGVGVVVVVVAVVVS